jgi:hypothetical protein
LGKCCNKSSFQESAGGGRAEPFLGGCGALFAAAFDAYVRVLRPRAMHERRKMKDGEDMLLWSTIWPLIHNHRQVATHLCTLKGRRHLPNLPHASSNSFLILQWGTMGVKAFFNKMQVPERRHWCMNINCKQSKASYNCSSQETGNRSASRASEYRHG